MKEENGMEKTKLNKKIAKEGRSRHNRKEMLVHITMVLPFVLLLLIFNYLPMFGTLIAFKKYNPNLGVFRSQWIGLDNFKYFFTSNDAVRVLRNTILYGVNFQITGLIAALCLAILLYYVNSKNALKYYQTTVILPNFLSMVLVAYIVYAFLNPTTGIVNKLIIEMGGEKKMWYSNAYYWPFILTIVNIWKHIGMDSMVYYAALTGIDESLFEAAKLDGASKWQEIRYIMLPEISSVICTLLILGVGNLVGGDFGLFYQVPMNIGVLYPTTDIINTYVFRGLENVSGMGQSTAVGLFQSVTALILVVASNLAIKKINPENSMF